MKDLNIVLVNPEIPQNTGNISRTSAVTGAALHIIRPTGFEISDRTLKRAGLDYWDKLDVSYYDSLDELYEKYPEGEFYYFSSHAERLYTDPEYKRGVFLVFGRESVGLPRELVETAGERALRIPMLPTLRCLNLSNSVAVAAYEALRQFGFPGMR
nr:tRNA (cytidine(34)-2'-O)-methyltransferase [Clostridia bacterium]